MSTEREESLIREALEAAQTERLPRWSPEQMVKCDQCERPNPPTRPACLYCGAVLPVIADTATLRRPLLRDLEEGEQGFNLVLAAPAPGKRPAQIAEMLHLSAAQWQTLESHLSAGRALPVARAASVDEANLLAGQLRQLGCDADVVPDEALTLEALPPKRLRAVEFTERSLTGWTFGDAEELRCAWTEVALLVSGRVFVRRVEVEERRARGPEKELLDAREIDSDEVLLDIYTNMPDGGWRIAAHSFDFSCLGQDKGLVAAENVNKLMGVMRERAAHAKFDDDYRRLRAALDVVWPAGRRSEARGLRRSFGGGYSSEAAVISTNLNQFTAYSRLCHHLLSARRA